jgi:hypothetical protein
MEHKPLAEIQAVADLRPEGSRALITRQERLARWVEALEREPKRILRPLHEIEFKKPQERRTVRADNSPLTVAYEDPVLRGEGLASDRLGDAMDFFELTEHEAHVAFCSCHLGSSFEARQAADRVRGLMKTNPRAQQPQQSSVLKVLFSALFGR